MYIDIRSDDCLYMCMGQYSRYRTKFCSKVWVLSLTWLGSLSEDENILECRDSYCSTIFVGFSIHLYTHTQGVSSAKLVNTQEPAFPRRKKILGHERKVTFTTDHTVTDNSPLEVSCKSASTVSYT